MSKRNPIEVINHHLSPYKKRDASVNYVTASNIMQSFTPEYDRQSVLQAISKRDGISIEEADAMMIQNNLKSIEIGNATHLFANYVFKHRNRIDTIKADEPHHSGVLRYWNGLDDSIIPIASELKLYHKKLKYVGVIDLLLYDADSRCLCIIDYKTNKDIFNAFSGTYMKEPFSKLQFSAHSKYLIELSLYKLLLNQSLKKVDISMKIVWILPSGSIIKIELDDYSDILKSFLYEASVK